jgi:hypothetical protein
MYSPTRSMVNAHTDLVRGAAPTGIVEGPEDAPLGDDGGGLFTVSASPGPTFVAPAFLSAVEQRTGASIPPRDAPDGAGVVGDTATPAPTDDGSRCSDNTPARGVAS